MLSHFLMLLLSSGMLLTIILIVFMSFSHFITIFTSFISVYVYSRIHYPYFLGLLSSWTALFLYSHMKLLYFPFKFSAAYYWLIMNYSILLNDLFYPLISSHAHLRIFPSLFWVKFQENRSFVWGQWIIVQAL